MASISLEIVPFPVPEHVTIKLPPGKRQDGLKPNPTMRLEELQPEVLEILLAEFCDAVMAKARGDDEK